MVFYKMDNKLLNDLNLQEFTNAYVLEKNKDIIGYGIITNDNNNKIVIFIKEEYRGKGSGKILFGKMLEELKKEDYKDIKISIKKDNCRIKNIVMNYGGLQLYTNEEEDVYLLPI